MIRLDHRLRCRAARLNGRLSSVGAANGSSAMSITYGFPFGLKRNCNRSTNRGGWRESGCRMKIGQRRFSDSENGQQMDRCSRGSQRRSPGADDVFRVNGPSFVSRPRISFSHLWRHGQMSNSLLNGPCADEMKSPEADRPAAGSSDPTGSHQLAITTFHVNPKIEKRTDHGTH